MKRRSNLIIWLGVIFIILLKYYIELPPINIHSPLFWYFFFSCMIFIILGLVLSSGAKLIIFKKFNVDSLKPFKYLIGGLISILVLIVVINIFSSPFFNAKEYGSRITILEDKVFTESIKPVDFTKTPLIDIDSSRKLGDRKMGEFTSWVSQFYVSDLYTQINYNSEIVRVTPLEYAGFIKYLTNRDEGIKGYIKVNSVTGSSSLVNLDKGMRYMPSSYFFENLYRKIRITYPFTIFDEESFEIDNEGNPYWIIPTVKYKAVGLKKEINGVIILDPITGDSKKYDLKDIPTWVDHVYSADIIIEQVNNWGEYKNGYLNSVFGQRDVVNTTEGYNYLVMDDDVYLYTGITSVSTDESNLGFVLANMRTKETNYYFVPGAEEYSAMASAEGLVQEKKYTASFPLLINLNNKPTYLLSLKDDAGLVKMYAFIDVADYQKVTVSDASLGIDAAAGKYLGDEANYSTGELKTKEIVVKSITNAVIDGNTYYYITGEDNNLYYASIKVNKDKLPFIKNGDKLSITYSDGSVSQIIKIGA
jgi:hypothetical protein